MESTDYGFRWWFALFGVVKEDHLVTSKLFGTILYTIDPYSGE